MGLFDELKATGSKVLVKSGVIAKEVAQKAQDTTELAKIKIDIATKDKEIKTMYARIGKAYYEAHKEDGGEHAKAIELINEKFAKIEELKDLYHMYKDNINAATHPFMKNEDEVDEFEETLKEVGNITEEVAEEAKEAVEEITEEILD